MDKDEQSRQFKEKLLNKCIKRYNRWAKLDHWVEKTGVWIMTAALVLGIIILFPLFIPHIIAQSVIYSKRVKYCSKIKKITGDDRYKPKGMS